MHEAIGVCHFDMAITGAMVENPKLMAAIDLAISCPVSDPAATEKRGSAIFERYVETLGVEQACAAFIAGIGR